jgi:hypothetical protein
MNVIAGHRGQALHRPSLVSPLVRTRVWVNRHAIDLRLAEGESVLSSADLAHRAGQLESVRWRRSLAAGIRRLIGDAEGPSRPLSSAVPIQRRAILCARSELERLAAAIDADAPVAVEGLAQAQLLITDGHSPLFSSSPDGAIEDAVRSARAALVVD